MLKISIHYTRSKEVLALLPVSATAAFIMLMLIKLQAKHLQSLELEHEMGAAEFVGRMEQDGAHPLHHSIPSLVGLPSYWPPP